MAVIFDPSIIKYQFRDAVLYWLVIPTMVILSGKGIDWFFHLSPFFSLFISYVVPCVLFGVGCFLIWWSTRGLSAAGGTPNPLRPAKKLVSRGAYAICRHPMFLGYDLCALAVILYIGSYGMLFGSLPVFLFFEVRFLKHEERILLLKFKKSYVEYIKNTPFLVPKLKLF